MTDLDRNPDDRRVARVAVLIHELTKDLYVFRMAYGTAQQDPDHPHAARFGQILSARGRVRNAARRIEHLVRAWVADLPPEEPQP